MDEDDRPDIAGRTPSIRVCVCVSLSVCSAVLLALALTLRDGVAVSICVCRTLPPCELKMLLWRQQWTARVTRGLHGTVEALGTCGMVDRSSVAISVEEEAVVRTGKFSFVEYVDS